MLTQDSCIFYMSLTKWLEKLIYRIAGAVGVASNIWVLLKLCEAYKNLQVEFGGSSLYSNWDIH